MDLKKTKNAHMAKFSRLHEDFGHELEDCTSLKIQVEKEICKGNLKEYIKGKPITTNMITGPVSHISVTLSREQVVSNS